MPVRMSFLSFGTKKPPTRRPRAECSHTLHMACHRGDLETVKELYETGVSTMSMWPTWATALSMAGDSTAHVAAIHGHLDILMFLKEKGVPLTNRRHSDGVQPIHLAAGYGRLEMLQWMYKQGVKLRCMAHDNSEPIHYASRLGNGVSTADQLLIVQWFRQNGVPARTVLNTWAFRQHHYNPDVIVWLERTRDCSTPLHLVLESHVDTRREDMPGGSADQALQLLRDGADPNAGSQCGQESAPPAASIARLMALDGKAPPGSAAAMVIKAAQPWSPSNHYCFPDETRAHAVELLLLGHALADRVCPDGAQYTSLVDVWQAYVMPHAVIRQRRTASAIHGKRLASQRLQW